MSYRIVLITEGLNGQRGGVQRVSREAFRVLQSDSIESIVWSSNDSISEQVSKSTGAQMNVTTECFEKNYMKMGLKALTASFPEDCEKIICWHLALAPIAAILSKRLHCPFHVFLHGVEAWGHLSVPQRWALSQTASVAANSQYTLDRFRKVHPEFARIEGKVLSLGLNEEFVEISKGNRGRGMGRRGDEEREKYFLTVTRLDETYKGVKNLIDAFALIQKNSSRIQLKIVGNGPAKKEIEEYVCSLNLSSAVSFLGEISDADLSKLYEDCLGFVLLSEGEGFGIVYLEAMFHGKACIATNADASQEIVRNNETGFTVAPGDCQETAKAMKNLIENTELRNRMGTEAYGRVLENFMPEHFQKGLREWMAMHRAEDAKKNKF